MKKLTSCLKPKAIETAFKTRKKVCWPKCSCPACLAREKKLGHLSALCPKCGHEMVSVGKRGDYAKVWRHKDAYFRIIGKPKDGLQEIEVTCKCGCKNNARVD